MNEDSMMVDKYVTHTQRQVRRHLDHISTRTINMGTGHESCQRVAENDCKGGDTRYYGEQVEHGFSGWRGPFCSAKCYKLMYQQESE